MTTHSKVMSAEDLLAKARSGTKEVYEITLRDLVVPIRILAIDEVNAVRRAAIREATIKGGDEVDRNVEMQKACLKLASTISKGGGPILGDKILAILSVDEINHLYNEYIRVMDVCNPSLEHIQPDEFRTLIDALKKKTISASDCSLQQLRAICTAYVDLIQRPATRS